MFTVSQISVSHRSAVLFTQAAVAYASKNQLAIAACVVDVHGRIKSLQVMDGAAIIADELVVKKARTALLGLSSAAFAEAVSAAPAVEKSMLTLPQMTLLGGGYPLIQGEEVIGAFAVGGASVELDIACAEAALDAVK
ncbi:MAG: heme-binding protein [Pseudomonadales bacterium]|nr:heme-binding protein [Pseudomonadales bacterium]